MTSRLGRLTLRIAVCVAVAASLVAVQPGLSSQAGNGDHWISTWGTAVVPRDQGPQGPGRGGGPPAPRLEFNNQTVRESVRVSAGGDRIRVVLSNVYGTETLVVGAAQVALRNAGSTIVPNSNRPLLFDGKPTARIAAGAVMISDPVALTVPSLADLAIDLYLPGDTASSLSPLTTDGARQTNYVSTTGNHAGAATFPVATDTEAWWFLSRVEVMAPAEAGTIVALGDSITDGNGSTTDAYGRWPDLLATRLADANIRMGVVNVGIPGNRVIGNRPNSASNRFDRDVLAQTGVAYVIFTEGINDLRNDGAPPVEELIMGHKQIIERAHAQGLRIIGGTILPLERDGEGGNGFNPTSEAARVALNEWIRTSGAYDGVIDFDAVMRDPARPSKLQAALQSGDWLHPNDAGYQKMAAIIDLSLFAPLTAGTK
ncbi:MAG: SGNH/GDSL hydrolase family protein [Acidobacteria bacterium]|nr:SGNH/GDSL hydrolase family protein [Acidobacteriota bacterium]